MSSKTTESSRRRERAPLLKNTAPAKRKKVSDSHALLENVRSCERSSGTRMRGHRERSSDRGRRSRSRPSSTARCWPTIASYASTGRRDRRPSVWRARGRGGRPSGLQPQGERWATGKTIDGQPIVNAHLDPKSNRWCWFDGCSMPFTYMRTHAALWGKSVAVCSGKHAVWQRIECRCRCCSTADLARGQTAFVQAHVTT